MEEEKEDMVNSKVALEIFLRILFYCAGGEKRNIGLFQPLTFKKFLIQLCGSVSHISNSRPQWL